MTLRTAMHQSELRRHLQTLMDRKSSSPESSPRATEAILPHSSIPHTHLQSDKHVDMFRGRLLGVEDELIDALVGERDSSHVANHQVIGLEPAIGGQFCWQPESERWKGRLLGVEDELIDALTLPEGRCSNTTTSPQQSGTPVFLDTCQHDIAGSDDGPAILSYEGAFPQIQFGLEHRVNDFSTPTTPLFDFASPPIKEPEPLGSELSSVDPDDFVVDSIILDRPGNMSLLGGWDLSDLQAMGNTMSDLLGARE